MEAKFGGEAHHLYGPVPVVSDLKDVGKKSLEWDLNDWSWDGDLFTASPLNSIPSDCRSRQLFPGGLETTACAGSDGNDPGIEKGKRELEKRRRPAFVDDAELNLEDGSLNLKLGGEAYPEMEGEVKSGKKTKIVGTVSNRSVCQVEDCRADLSNAKDYHRRHKVCDMHSKASKALVGNFMQRFCQQCSRLVDGMVLLFIEGTFKFPLIAIMVVVNAFFAFLTTLFLFRWYDERLKNFLLLIS